MFSYPICGDPSRMRTYYVCKPDDLCANRPEGGRARFRKTVDDSGDVCEDVRVDCQC